ncbi:MAG: hypothetical protein WCI22_12715 [Actinomycetota bacterium]
MTEQPHASDDQRTTYGRKKGKWNKTMTAGGGHEGPSPRLIVAAVLAVVMIVFVVRNGHATSINFLFFSWDTTVRWSLFIAILLGVALDRLVIWGRARRKKDHDGAQQNETAE